MSLAASIISTFIFYFTNKIRKQERWEVKPYTICEIDPNVLLTLLKRSYFIHDKKKCEGEVLEKSSPKNQSMAINKTKRPLDVEHREAETNKKDDILAQREEIWACSSRFNSNTQTQIF